MTAAARSGPTQRVVVVGQGYVGLPLAVRAAEQGYEVVGYDLDKARIEMLAAGSSYVEDVADARLASLVARGALRPSSDRGSGRLRHRCHLRAHAVEGRVA